MKNIITVNGPVDAASCAMVLSHEHLFIDLTNQASATASGSRITSADRARLLCDPYCMRDNLLIDDLDAAVAEGRRLMEIGCDTVVDCTLREIGRDPLLLKEFSRLTGMKVVMGCGWYTGDTHPDEVAKLSVEALAEQLICEIRNGVDGSGILPGIIGEIGTGKEILPGEWKALEASAIAQKASGLAVQVHIFPWSSNGIAVSEFLMKKGVDPRRIVICHSDVSPDYDYISALLRMGVWVQLDNFGKEFTPEAGGFAAGDFVRDSVRAEIAGRIIRDGFGSQLLMTNDICLKCMLSEYGGAGYTHVFTRAVPEIAAMGIPVDYLKDVIMKKNPLEMLCGE